MKFSKVLVAFKSFSSRFFSNYRKLYRLKCVTNTPQEVLFHTAELIASRNARLKLEEITVGYCNQLPATHHQGGVGTRWVEDSFLELILPFGKNHNLRDIMSRSNGKTVQYGKLFEILDTLAADVACRHLGDPEITVVTASVDGMSAFSDILISKDLIIHAYLTYVGKSSMEVLFM